MQKFYVICFYEVLNSQRLLQTIKRALEHAQLSISYTKQLHFAGNWMATTTAELVPGPEPPPAAVASTLQQDITEGTR